MVTERKVSYKEVKTFVFYSCPNSKRIDEEKCENEQITFLQIQKVILHLLKKEFLLSSTQMKKLMDFNKEAGEKRKEQIQKAVNCKNRWMVLTGRTVPIIWSIETGAFHRYNFWKQRRSWKKKGTGSADIT